LAAEQTDEQLQQLSDEALWQAYVKGNEAAFAEVQRRYRDLLFRYLALSLNELRPAIEQLGRLLSKVAACRRPYEGFDSLRGWLLAVATQQVVPAHHREDPGFSEFFSDLRRAQPADKEALVRRALADLRREERQPLLLTAVCGLSVAEAAKACRFTPQRTMALIQRAYREMIRSGVFSED